MSSLLKRPNRESVTTINDDGSRSFIYPADVSGLFTVWRRLVGYALMGLYVSLPWIPINGNPAVFLDLNENQFHLFGLTFVGQDIWLGFFVVSGLAFSLYYVTALLGRVWCGWACPQTVFLDHVVRRIERMVEGNAVERRALAKEPWNSRKVRLYAIKHFLFFLLAFVIAHVFLSYFTSLPALFRMMSENPWEHQSYFLKTMFVTGALYFNFAWFREQFCIVLCPYGRFQSALIDDHSVIIGYDEKRGEPRGKAKESGVGDCVDCMRCVQVCPTGIDIRQGLQIECIGCANCIDACDEVMVKLDRPKGLVRYDSFQGLRGLKTKIIRPRIILYTFFLLLGIAAMAWAVSGVRPVTLSALRMVGAPYYLDHEKGTIRNQYLVRILNKKNETVKCQLELEAHDHPIEGNGVHEEIEIPPLGEIMRPVVVTLPQSSFKGRFSVKIEVESEVRGFSISKTVPFLGPNSDEDE
jgi:cytochrome c oxidase accessory protein FixG